MRDPEEQAAVLSFLHDLFRPPEREQWLHVSSTQVARAWSILASGLVADAAPDLPLPASGSAYQEEYLSMFEVGHPEPPCPLLESHWNRDPDARAENLMFFRRFGLKLRSSVNGPPDLLLHQLDFARYLSVLRIDSPPERAAQLDRAFDDYLTRHLGWTSRAAEAAAAVRPGSWASGWMHLLDGCIRALSP